MLKSHLQRLTDGLSNRYSRDNLSTWCERNIVLEGAKISFGDKYSFQRKILDDTSRVTSTVKLAQIGLTTLNMAYILAGMATQPKFNCIYALPSASDASKLVTTKLNPLIYESPEIKRILDYNVDSVELKKIGQNFLFTRGTRSETAALSISADALIIDELDRCDPDVVKQFRSRLQASNLRIVKQFSTPTVEGVGIDKESRTAKRYRHMATCSHCNHTFLPSALTDIIIPDFSRDLSEVTASSIKDLRWQESRWNCPECGKDPNLHPSRLEWVCENPYDNYEANCYFVSAATACLVLPPSYFVNASTEFTRRSEYLNQCLGLCASEENEQLTAADVERSLIQAELASSDPHFMGIDLGLLSACTVGRMTQDGHFIVVHREMIPLQRFEQRRNELIQKYKIISTVMDCQPYVNLVTTICDYDPRAYGAIFTTSKSPELYTVTEKDNDKEDGKLNLRLLKVNRTALMDMLLDLFKKGSVIMRQTEETDKFSSHYTSLKRTMIIRSGELVADWQKTDNEDHFLFSLGYLYLATRVGRGIGFTVPGAVSLVSSFKLLK